MNARREAPGKNFFIFIKNMRGAAYLWYNIYKLKISPSENFQKNKENFEVCPVAATSPETLQPIRGPLRIYK
jgi:hypothetical protein